MTQAAPEPGQDFEAWRALQEVLEERDREYWVDDVTDTVTDTDTAE